MDIKEFVQKAMEEVFVAAKESDGMIDGSVEFDLAVTVAESSEKDRGAKLSVGPWLSAGAGVADTAGTSSTSRIKFRLHHKMRT